jgi:hypothetical protein
MTRFLLTLCILCILVIIMVSNVHVRHRHQIESFKQNDNIPRVDFVIARYAETLDWLCSDLFQIIFNNRKDVIINIYVYNKGNDFELPKCIAPNINVYMKRLDNVGRCDHTYIYHIVQNYDSLADVTVFLPGSCDMENKIERTTKIVQDALANMNTAMICEEFGDDVKTAFYDFQLDEYLSSNHVNAKQNQDASMEVSKIRPFGKWFEHVFGRDTITKCVNMYGILAVSRTDIRRRHVDFYKMLLGMLNTHNNPEVGHYIERSWHAIFDPTIKDASKK